MIIRSFVVTFAATLFAQTPPRPPQVISPEVQPDRTVTFRLLAPDATEVKLNRGDIPASFVKPMTKGETGVWEVTIGPLVPGAYRYTFNVNGLPVNDPRNPTNSESNDNVWSMAIVPGSDAMDTREVPHGAVAAITYRSKSLGRARRMHVYTPPGYESNKEKYPVFYLLHGSSDSDHAWTSVGRAGFILDNLIAAKKAKPMIVVMPHGHTTRGGFRQPGQPDEFNKDFVEDIMPYVESHYRTVNDRAHRAMAGLSMGGGHTLRIGVPHLDRFAYLGIFSSGLNAQGATAWEQQNAAVLDNAKLRKGLDLIWIGVGKEDRVLESSQKTVELFKKHGFTVVEHVSEGGHTWLNWRDYLIEFTPKLFQ